MDLPTGETKGGNLPCAVCAPGAPATVKELRERGLGYGVCPGCNNRGARRRWLAGVVERSGCEMAWDCKGAPPPHHKLRFYCDWPYVREFYITDGHNRRWDKFLAEFQKCSLLCPPCELRAITERSIQEDKARLRAQVAEEDRLTAEAKASLSQPKRPLYEELWDEAPAFWNELFGRTPPEPAFGYAGPATVKEKRARRWR